MCGILAIIGSHEGLTKHQIKRQFMLGKGRGPESSVLRHGTKGTDHMIYTLGFHRLAINGLTPSGNQPMTIGGVTLICNGEIYNHAALYQEYGYTATTGSDCEIILHLFLHMGITETLNRLDGVFAFILVDSRTDPDSPTYYIARDPFGVRPLYQCRLTDPDGSPRFCFASEIKCIQGLSVNKNPVTNKKEKEEEKEETTTTTTNITHFPPGKFSIIDSYNNSSSDSRYVSIRSFQWFHPLTKLVPLSSSLNPSCPFNISCLNVVSGVRYYLNEAVLKRCQSTERPIACLLSGGLDSSLIAALVNRYKKGNEPLETYSIGLADSEDLKYARIMADHLKSKHTEVVVRECDMFNAIIPVIKALESCDTTTVRASLGNYLIGKHIRMHSKAKVIFNGDGSDELFGGYLYMKACPSAGEFDKETRRLLQDIHLFDVLRSDKCISSHGLEPRTPFLDRSFVQYVLTIPAEQRYSKGQGQPEKHLLRQAFAEDTDLLPSSILWRPKEAFSDGVSSLATGRSLFTLLQHMIQKQIVHEINKTTTTPHDVPNQFRYHIRKASNECLIQLVSPLHQSTTALDQSTTKLALHQSTRSLALAEQSTRSLALEKDYYRQIYHWYFPRVPFRQVVPYEWMPKYTNAKDPSARTLALYQNNNVNTKGMETLETLEPV